MSITLGAITVLLVAVLILALFVAAPFNLEAGWLIVGLFCVSKARSLERCSRFIRDMNLVAWWVSVLVLVGVGLATFLVLLLYQNIVARKAETTQHVFRVVNVDDVATEPVLWEKNYPRQFADAPRSISTPNS